MKKIDFALIFKISSSFLVNLAAGYFLLIYVAPTILDKVNALITCVGCLVMTYIIEKVIKS